MTAPVSFSQVTDMVQNLAELAGVGNAKPGSSFVADILSLISAGGGNANRGVENSGAETVGGATVPSPPPRFDAADLYDVSGRPREADIDQDSIGDCYYVATLGAVAERTPTRIQDAIKYDSATGTFSVKMYSNEWSWSPPGFKQVTIPVTQQDLVDNLTRRGGSTVDNKTGVDGPIWPAVMETAYAKMHDSNWSDGLAQGYTKIDGGWAKDAMRAVTGTTGDVVTGMGMFPTKTQAEILYMQVDNAIRDGRPVTLSTDPEKPSLYDIMNGKAQDGLVDNHVYMVDRIYKDSNGDVMVELRNPWGRNLNVGEGKDTASASITVKLETMLELESLECFNVGPRK